MPPEPEAGTLPPQPEPTDSLVETTVVHTAEAPPIVTNDPPPPVEDKVHEMPEAAFKKLKEKEREKGRKAAMAEFAQRAKDAGYDSPDAAYAEINKLNARLEELSRKPEPKEENTDMAHTKTRSAKKSPAQPRRSSGRNKGNRMEDSKSAKEIARLERARSKASEKWRREEKRRKLAERKLMAKDAEMEIRQIAMDAGITGGDDLDYAVTLMARNLQKKQKEKGFDMSEYSETDFFEGLKEKRPYLFGEKIVPATTGTGAGNEDTPLEPKPGEVITKNAEDTHFDATKAEPEEVRARLRELGLQTGGVAVG